MVNKTINCAVGVLTYNSAKGLRRCLESVRDFKEIIIADGGSTDETLSIAKEFGAIVISQSNPGSPISDFSRERQITLDKASTEWFFYLDSDEIMTAELREEIRRISSESNPKNLIYKVRYQLSTPDFKKRYISYKPYYQTRLFNKKSGAFFIKKVHEKIKFDKDLAVGIINEPWLVPLDDQLDFSVYKSKVAKRLSILANEWHIKNPVQFILKGLWPQVAGFTKQMYKLLVLRIRERKENIVPFKYELYRLYSPLLLSALLIKRYFLLLFKHPH